MYKKTIVLAIAFCLFAFGASQAFSEEPDYVAGEVLVRFKPKENGAQRNTQERNEILASFGGVSVVKNLKLIPGLSLVKLPQGMSVNTALTNFSNAAEIIHVQPNYIYRAISVFPNEPRFNEFFGLHNTGQNGGTPDADIDAPEAWEITTESSIVVAVIDTGIDYTHPELAANIWHNPGEIPGNGIDDDGNGYIDDIYGYDFCNEDNDPMDDHNHGTHVAGIIGAVGNNGQGVAGVCWNVKIMALKFLDSGAGGNTVDAIECITYAITKGAKILNNSWGNSQYDQTLKNAIDAADANGILLTAAAGNYPEHTNNDVYPVYPASYNSGNIIAVMASDESDNLAHFSGGDISHYGAASVDLAAPGKDILSCIRGGLYASWGGTSMATPHVTGACALVWSMNPELTHLQVKDVILSTVDASPYLNGLCVTGGRLNLYKALIESANSVNRVGVSDNVSVGSSVSPGDELTYRIWFQAGLSGVNITDYLPDEVNYPNFSDPNYDMFAHTYTWTPGPNEPNFLELTVVANAVSEPGGAIHNVCLLEASGIQAVTAVEVTDVNCWGSGIIYVNKEAGGLPIGTSWENAYPDLHNALVRSNSGGRNKIWVKSGRYTGVLPRYLRYPVNSMYVLPDGVEIFGGFKGNESTLSERQLDDPNNETVLDGDTNNDGIADATYVVLSESGVQKSVVDGFTIREGDMAGVDVNDSWAGIYNCLIRDNEYRGVWCRSGSLLEIVNCEVKNNNSESFGYGIYCTGSSLITVHDSNIHGHLYDGIYSSGSDPCIIGCVIKDNERYGIYCTLGVPVIKNNWILENGNGDDYGVYLNSLSAGGVLRNNTIVNNNGWGLRFYGTGSRPPIINSIIWGNTSAQLYLSTYNITYSCIQGSPVYTGIGNINTDPCFVAAESNDYHIKENSLCIDKGNSSVVQTNETDIDGKNRLLDGDGNDTVIVDIGADEYYWSPADFDENGDVNFIDFAILSSAWKSIYGNTNYNEECDVEYDNVIDFKDLRLFCEDWLWDKDTAQGYMMGMGGGGESGFGGEGMEFSQESLVLEETETVYESEPAPAPEIDPNVVIDEMLKWLEEYQPPGWEELVKQLSE